MRRTAAQRSLAAPIVSHVDEQPVEKEYAADEQPIEEDYVGDELPAEEDYTDEFGDDEEAAKHD